jgi:RecB family exonuclease
MFSCTRRYDLVVIEFPHVTPGEAVVVSATLHTTYLRCPEQALGRLRGEYPAESRASFRGGLAHRVFARHLSEGAIEAGDLAQVCREEIGRSMNPKISALGVKPSELGALIMEVGELYERFKRISAEGFNAAEVFLESEPAEGVTLRGSVDAVFDDPEVGVRLVDWKTGSVVGAENQLAFYSFLWALEKGELPGAVEAVSVATGERYTAVPTLSGSEATAAAVADQISRLREAFAAGGELRRTGGPLCRYCPLLEGCAEGATAAALFAT